MKKRDFAEKVSALRTEQYFAKRAARGDVTKALRILKRAGVSPEEATLNENLKGLTATPLPGGGISEVYWNRCELLSGVAGAIFHEACHLKFKAKRHNEMHDAVGSDGKKVWILGTNNMNAAHPNTADIEVFKSKIPNAVPLRNRLPS